MFPVETLSAEKRPCSAIDSIAARARARCGSLDLPGGNLKRQRLQSIACVGLVLASVGCASNRIATDASKMHARNAGPSVSSRLTLPPAPNLSDNVAPVSAATPHVDGLTQTAAVQRPAKLSISGVAQELPCEQTSVLAEQRVVAASGLTFVEGQDSPNNFPHITQNQSGITLSDLEALAHANNPTLRELAATTQKAAGFRTQVGLRANPTVGYQAMQLADQGTDQHTAFVEQEFVTGDKLALNRHVLNEALRSQLLELETQKIRVTTEVRTRFYAALAAQMRVELISNFRAVTGKGLELAELRLQAQEGSRVDLLQAKVQKNEVDLTYEQAQVTLAAAWRELAAVAGSPQLPMQTLLGELPSGDEPLDWDELRVQLVAASPEYHAAQARISRARANLRRQGVQSIPNITAQLAAGVDNGTDSGLINFQLGAPLPLFNQNQGNVAAARAEYCRAVWDAQRIMHAMQARLANVSQAYDSSLAAVTMYADEILPSAKESMELAEQAHTAGETNFIQVLVARRTFFDSTLRFVQAQSELAQARSQIDGYVLSGALEPVIDESGDDGLRGLTFSQQ